MDKETLLKIVDEEQELAVKELTIEAINRKTAGNRPISLYKWERVGDDKHNSLVLDVPVATFHQFGVDYNDGCEAGFGRFTTAIVELPDGTVRNIPVGLVKFLDVPDLG